LEGLPPGVLQVLMGQQWLPVQDGVAEVAVLPGQMFKGWVPVEQTLYTAAQVRCHINNLGTLSLKVNDELKKFEL
jgi:formylmethanofuran dehydrogenase subunit A